MAVANLDLLEAHGSRRHVQGHWGALRHSNRHRAGRVVDGLNRTLDAHLAFRFAGLRRRYGRRDINITDAHQE